MSITKLGDQKNENLFEETEKSDKFRPNEQKKNEQKKADEAASSNKKGGSEKESLSTFQQIREICESLAVALFLAFLFKTFEAEAFVIPTGSMAPTLKGRHKDVVCSECGFPFQTSASEEIDSSTTKRTGRHVVAGTCPQCGYTCYFGDEIPSLKNDKEAPSFTGDRILVSKMTFDQRELSRWDVSVFRSPADPKINFIKRIVGLPNENLRVQYGDLFVQKLDPSSYSQSPVCSQGERASDENIEWAPDVDLAQTDFDEINKSDLALSESSSEPFEIARKDYKYLRQILQVVYDADYPTPKLTELGWPERFSDDYVAAGQDVEAWRSSVSKKGRVYRFDNTLHESEGTVRQLRLGTEADVSPVVADDESLYWLRYRHVVPSSDDWFYLSNGVLPPKVKSRGIVDNNPRLIDDFSSYNAGISRHAKRNVLNGAYEWDKSSGDEFAYLSKSYEDEQGKTHVFCSKNPDGFGCNWVGDLAVSCSLTFEDMNDSSGRLVFDLVKGGVVFRCVVEPTSGNISLSIPSIPEFKVKETTFKFKKNESYKFDFLNVDEEMRVVINEHELEFPGTAGRYDFLSLSEENVPALLPRNRDPNARDLAPVAIGVKDSVVRLERLRVLRDVYYIAIGRSLESWNSKDYNDFGTGRCDRLTKQDVRLGDEEDAARFMSSPDAWEGYGNTKSALLCQHEGQYVAFGDNSGFSLDSRLWASNVTPHYVDRKYLIGKAFYVYWPHGWNLPLLNLPFWPNFADMRRID